MTMNWRNVGLFAVMALLFVLIGEFRSWSSSLFILNFCLISAVMSLGVNIQWGYAGLLNVGIMGFVALGGVAATLVSIPAVPGAIEAGGAGILISLVCAAVTIGLISIIYFRTTGSRRGLLITVVGVVGYFITRHFFDPAVGAIEAYDSAGTGNLGGLNLPILFSWIVGGLLAAVAAWLIGKISLGLRSDYLAIATLGISEIIIAMLKNEDWLTRGVKNVNGLPRPAVVPYEVDIQKTEYYQQLAADWGMSVIDLSSLIVKLSYASLFAVVLLIILFLSEKALNSPWGRMMRAIRDNETAAEAMGKDVKGRHLQVFILGSAVVGIAGAMLTTLDGLFTPAAYQPLRYTFLIWVMVIVGGSGNNWGAVLGGFVIGFFWIEAEPLGLWLMDLITSGLAEDSELRAHLLKSAAHMRLMTMGIILLLVLRFTPRGLIPER
ncbi:MAG: branched-chain amino acid ABC transporter permease [Pseudomonadota bacterium]